MPSHKIHLAIAIGVNEKIKMDEDRIMLGSVLPDLAIKKHQQSHYQNGKWGIEGVANPDVFLLNQRTKMNNPIMVGYLLHLLTDKFYNEYMYHNFYYYDENNVPIALKIKGERVELEDQSIKKIKQGDFSMYDKYLMVNQSIHGFNDAECTISVTDFDDIKFDKEELIKYINSTNKSIKKSKQFKLLKKVLFKPRFTLVTLKEMDNVYSLCLDYIINYLKENNVYR